MSEPTTSQAASPINPDPMSPTSDAAVEGGAENPTEPEVRKPVIDPTKDLWQNISGNVKDALQEQTDQTVIVVGSRNCGKTTLIRTMLGKGGKDGGTKATTALEYCYGKREDRNSTQIAHFWELAHDAELSQLTDVVLTGEGLHQTVCVIAVDCGDPLTMWSTAEGWLRRIDRRIQDLFQKMRAKNSSTPDKLLKKMKQRVGEDHPDLSKMRLLGVPVLLVATRLDLAPADTVKMKTMVRTLRFLAHLYGASLVFTSPQEREVVKFTSFMQHLIFGIPFDMKHVQHDSDKGGVLIPAGRDSFQDIGDAVPTTPPGFKPCGDSELDRWKAPFDECFPPKQVTGQTAEENDEFYQQLYDVENGEGDPAIDLLRKQKDEELELYIRSAKKEAKDAKDGKDSKKRDDE